MPTKNKVENKVDAECLAYLQMSEHWRLIHDLLGGTQAMRAASTTWLPREPREEDDAYNARLARSILFGGFKDTVEKLSSKPFSRPITDANTEKLPDQLQLLIDDADRTGKSLTQFALEVFTSAVTYGLCHILVDYPAIRPEGDEEVPTVAEEKEQDIRPYFARVDPPDLLGWRHTRSESGKLILTQLRIREKAVEPDGDFGEQEVSRIRVLYPDRWELHEKKAGASEYTKVQEGNIEGGGMEITLATFYINQTGVLTGEPPLEDLAFLNLAHWQSDSDQRNILRFARTGILFMSGLTDDDMEKEVTVGANRLFRTTSENADMKYVEHTGHAIQAGSDDLKQLIEAMEILGLQPLMERGQGKTATGRSMDEARTESSIQTWIRSLESTLRHAFELAGRWVGTDELDEEFSLDIFSDFGISIRGTADIESLIKMREKKQISSETFLREVKRRGTLSDALDLDAEMALVEEEQEAQAERDMKRLEAANMGADDDSDDDADDDDDSGDDG